MDFDLVVTGGTVIDGTGAPRFAADIGVANGRIVAIVPRSTSRLQGLRTIDAGGKIVAPGFVDGNSHADWVLPQPAQAELLAPLLLQGVTTVVGGADPPLVNAGFLVGQNTLRDIVMGVGRRTPSPYELAAMQGLLRQALRDGAYGLSGNLGFRPGRFASDRELSALARVVAEEDGVCAVHARAYTWVSDAYPLRGAPHNLRAVRDLIELARGVGVRLQVSHLLFAGRRT